MQQVSDYIEIETHAGHTFDSLALDYCGNENLSSEIIALNPDYSNVLIFGEGCSLKIPVYDEDTSEETLPPWRTEGEDGPDSEV